MIGTSQLINAFGGPVCFTDTTDIFKDGSGVALYSLDYDGTDAGGGGIGKFGQAAIFNGSNSILRLPGQIPASVASDYSISFWVNPTSIGVNGNAIFRNFYGSGSYVAGQLAIILLDYNSLKRLRIYQITSNGSSTVAVYESTSAISENTWTHIACVIDVDGAPTAYVNGNSFALSSAGSTYLSNPEANSAFGEWQGEPYYHGKIDQVRVFNKALTTTEITTLSNESKATTNTLQILGDTSCVATYKLDGNSTDLSGNYDGTGTNVTYKYDGSPVSVDFGVEGKSNHGAGFNGSSSVITLSSTISSIKTYSFWINPDSSGNATYARRLFGDIGGTSYTNSITFDKPNSKVTYFEGTTARSSATISNDAWSHIVFTSDGTTLKVYTNGSLSNTYTTSGFVSSINEICSTSSNRQFKGSIDQVRIFNKAISASEVSTLYGSGAGEIACVHTATADNINYPVANLAHYKFDNNSKSEIASTHYLFIGDAGNQSSSGRLNSVDADFTYTRPTGYSEWGGSWDTSNKTGSATQTFEESDKKWTKTGSYYNAVWSTNKYHSGKYYAEIEFLGAELVYGISRLTSATGAGTTLQNGSIYYGSWATHSWKYSTTNTAEGAILSTNDVIGLAADFDNQILQVYRNNVLLDTVSIARSDGTDTNVEYRFGRFGQALKYSGASSHAETTLANSNFTSNYSISFWVNLDNANTFQNFVGNYKSSGGYGGFTFMSRDVGSGVYRYGFIWWYTTGDLYNYVDNNDVLATSGTWVHLVATKASGALPKLYVNGTASSLNYRNAVTDHATTTENFKIGNTLNNNYSAGLIDQVRVFNSELSASQVTQLYNEKPETDTSNFKAVLYEGNGGTNFISNVGFQPDLVWVKARDDAHDHVLYDTVRGVGSGKALSSNATYAEGAYDATYGFLDTFEATGFVAKTGSSNANYTNKNNEDYAAWAWKAGGPAVSNAVGTITSQVSANQDTGFSIIRNTGTANYSDTIGHGLSQAPEIVIQKTISSAVDWYVLFNIDGTGGWDWGKLNSTVAFAADNPVRFSANSTTINNWGWTGYDMINYCWHSVAGYSKIGSYTGSGVSGKQVTLDFNPSFVLIKRTNSPAKGWLMVDDKRGTYELFSHLSAAEDTSVTAIVLGANKFTLNTTNDWYNGSGGEYLYMAFK